MPEAVKVEKLEHWTHKRDAELLDHRTRPPTKTGITAHLWGGWRWELSDGRVYRTNGEGEGLWRWNESRAEWQQIRGTCQFSLPADREQARVEIERMYCDASETC